MNSKSLIQTEATVEALQTVDDRICQLTTGFDVTELRPPCLISAETLGRAEYAAAFPHLLMGACAAANPDTDPAHLFTQANLAEPQYFLSPAACYHAYDFLAGETLNSPLTLTMRARCFRNEDRKLASGRRQIEFEMREIVFVGPEEWIDQQVLDISPKIDEMAEEWALETDWETATDPFFMPRAEGKAHMQRLLGAKQELCVRGEGDGLAVGSINRHGTFFGERFEISYENQKVHTACVAFGLDRLQHQIELTSK